MPENAVASVALLKEEILTSGLRADSNNVKILIS